MIWEIYGNFLNCFDWNFKVNVNLIYKWSTNKCWSFKSSLLVAIVALFVVNYSHQQQHWCWNHPELYEKLCMLNKKFLACCRICLMKNLECDTEAEFGQCLSRIFFYNFWNRYSRWLFMFISLYAPWKTNSTFWYLSLSRFKWTS